MSDESILPGAEPFHFPGGPVGVLVCHGFTGTTQSMRPLGEAIAAAGYTVTGPRLAGHGVTPHAMARTGAADWICSVDAAIAALRRTCERIVLVGLSMGGTLSLHAAARHGDVIAGVVPINGAVTLESPELGSIVLAPDAPEFLPGVGSDIKAPGVVELAYPHVPVAALRELYALVAATYAMLPRVTCPALVFQSREDHVVAPSNATSIVSRLGSARVDLRWLDDSYHVATLDNDRERIARETIAFVGAVAGR